METKEIDIDHIVALQEINGLLKNIEIPITRPEQFIAELEAMIDNPNRTVWDMQSHFTSRFPKAETSFDYLQPHSYTSSYVSCVCYPHLTDYTELRRTWEEIGKSAREAYLTSCEKMGMNPDTTVASQKEVEAIKTRKYYQKCHFYKKAISWINASCYYDEANRLNQNGSIKMFSKENIGWSHFTHIVNKDIKVALKTNFGFGSAAYFLLAVQYKGVNILPYSYIVKYYKARMADIVRCTRSYSPRRDSWSAAFDFLSDFVNNSVTDPEGFVKTYIMTEVTEMMKGLEAISINPEAYIKSIGNRKADPCVINVRPMFDDDIKRMQSYPDETPILIKVEKIVGALDFLESLTAIAKEVNMVQPHIDRLIELNMALYPEVQDAVDKTSSKVEVQEKIKTSLDMQISSLTKKLTPFETEVGQLRAKATNENPFIMSDYEYAHPEYKEMKEEKIVLNSNLYKVNQLIRDLNSFITILNRSLSIIEKVKQSVTAA